jgi:hypothetical protein
MRAHKLKAKRTRAVCTLVLAGCAFLAPTSSAQTPDSLTLRCEGQARTQQWGLGERNPAIRRGILPRPMF